MNLKIRNVPIFSQFIPQSLFRAPRSTRTRAAGEPSAPTRSSSPSTIPCPDATGTWSTSTTSAAPPTPSSAGRNQMTAARVIRRMVRTDISDHPFFKLSIILNLRRIELMLQELSARGNILNPSTTGRAVVAPRGDRNRVLSEDVWRSATIAATAVVNLAGTASQRPHLHLQAKALHDRLGRQSGEAVCLAFQVSR